MRVFIHCEVIMYMLCSWLSWLLLHGPICNSFSLKTNYVFCKYCKSLLFAYGRLPKIAGAGKKATLVLALFHVIGTAFLLHKSLESTPRLLINFL
ncbi:hypothetical protein FKM82_012305 [Ascaphus truei]